MIFDYIFAWLGQMLGSLFDLMPTIPTHDFSSETGAISGILAWAGWANYYTPVDSAVVILLATLGVSMGWFLFDLCVYVLTKLHIFGGSSS